MGNILYGPVASHAVAVFVSLVLHAVVIAFLAGHWVADEPRKIVTPTYINAILLELEAKPKPKPKEQADQAAKRRAEERRKAEQRREAEAERKRQQQKRAEEKHRKEQAERERQEKLKREREAAQRAEQERLRQQEFANALAEEEKLLQAANDAQMAAAYSAYIRERIASNWSRPPSARRGMKAVLSIQLLPNGQVASVAVVESSGNDAFDRSAEQAVRKVERFERLKEMSSDVFERNFRRLTLLFSPDDLRL